MVPLAIDLVLRPVLHRINSTVASGSCVKHNEMGIWKMNERIKELKKQAWEYAMAVHEGHIVPPLDKEVWPIDKVLDEKFAELIVRECEKVAKGGSWYYDAPSCGWRNPINFVCNEMKEHFGVEE